MSSHGRSRFAEDGGIFGRRDLSEVLSSKAAIRQREAIRVDDLHILASEVHHRSHEVNVHISLDLFEWTKETKFVRLRRIKTNTPSYMDFNIVTAAELSQPHKTTVALSVHSTAAVLVILVIHEPFYETFRIR